MQLFLFNIYRVGAITPALFPSSSCNLSNTIWPSAASRHAVTFPQNKWSVNHVITHPTRKKKDSNIPNFSASQSRHNVAAQKGLGERTEARSLRVLERNINLLLNTWLSTAFCSSGLFWVFFFFFLTDCLKTRTRPLVCSCSTQAGCDSQLGALLQRCNTVFTTKSGGPASHFPCDCWVLVEFFFFFFGCACGFEFYPLGSVGDLIFTGDWTHLQLLAVSGKFKAAAPER